MSGHRTSRSRDKVLELWLTITVLYFAAGFLRLMVSYRHLDDLWERRRLGALCLVLVILEVITVHNLFTRNWTNLI